jgi:hypothetical protein
MTVCLFYYKFIYFASIPRAEKIFDDLLVRFFFLLYVSKAVKAPIYLASNKALFIFASLGTRGPSRRDWRQSGSW